MKNNLKLAAPWYTYQKKVKALFDRDPEIKVGDIILPEDGRADYLFDIEIRNHEKFLALDRVFPKCVQFGNITLANLKNGVLGAGEHHFLYGKVFCGECGAPFVRRTLKTKGGVYYKAWNCRERQKGQKGNGCRCRLISEESLIDEIMKALGWETMDEGRFNREVSRVLVSDDDVQVEC